MIEAFRCTDIEPSKLPFNDYFSNKKYSNYPVVGISQKQAICYCSWRTSYENNKLQKKGKPFIHDYRLPSEVEWAYVADQPVATEKNKIMNNQIHPTNKGEIQDWGLYNLAGNVSEWTSSPTNTKPAKTDTSNINTNLRIVCGGSWKSTTNITERKVMDENTRENYIGFRIVRSYLGL